MPLDTDDTSLNERKTDALGASGPCVSPVRNACRLVQMLAGEMVMIAGDRSPLRRNRRRTLCHTRQIAMYVCHVALQIPQSDVGAAFGKDRSTVGYACAVVEDRRDDEAFDAFVAAMERIAREVVLGEGAGDA